MDIEAWLCGPGSNKYVRAFRDNHIDAAVLRSLTAEGSQRHRDRFGRPPPDRAAA